MVTGQTASVGVQGPEYAVARYTEVYLWTAAGAHLHGERRRLGSSQLGYMADLVAFQADLITCAIDDLPEIRPVFTIVAGRTVYDPNWLIPAVG